MVAPSVASRQVHHVRTPATETLSQREQDVLTLIAAGRDEPRGCRAPLRERDKD
ncbi:MAG: hypothetical protein ACXVDA_23480 [Ktedonobacterales bacterium]